MKVYRSILEYSNGSIIYVKGISYFFEDTAMYLESKVNVH
jgi:hypothetical protein